MIHCYLIYREITRIRTNKLFKISLLSTAIILAFMLVMAAAAPFTQPGDWWFITLPGLLWVYLVFENLVCGLILFFYSRKLALIPVIALLLFIPGFLKSWSFGNTKTSGNQKQFTVLTWNVGLMNFLAPTPQIAENRNNIIINRIKNSKADVVCLQEFFTAVVPGTNYNFIDSISKTCNYPYHFFVRDYPFFKKSFYSGTVIFSRHKITDSNRIVFPHDSSGSIADIMIERNDDTIQIISSRFQSFYFQENDYRAIQSLKKLKINKIESYRSLLAKMKLAYQRRSEQILMVDSIKRKAVYPLIIACDLNDIPLSNAYRRISSGITDSWLSAGGGLGRTYRHLLPTLRIDYIFSSRSLLPVDSKVMHDDASDHYPVLSTFTFRDLKNK